MTVSEDGGVAAAAKQVGTSNQWTYTATNIADGGHTFAAVVTDSAGNSSSANVTDQVDSKAPTISLAQSASGNLTNSTSDTITVTATDGAGSGVKSVEIYDNGKDIGAATQVGISNNWALTATGLANGTHSFDAVATDSIPAISRRCRPRKPSPTKWTRLGQP